MPRRINASALSAPRGTIKSHTYENEIKQLDPAVKVTAVACPLFVPFVEEGWLTGQSSFRSGQRLILSH